MSSCTSFRLQSARAVAIVEQVKLLTNELMVAICQDDSINKFCFHGVITDRAKSVESAKEKFTVAAENLEKLSGQLALAKEQLQNITLQYQRLVDENTTLDNNMESIKSGLCLSDEEQKLFKETSMKMKLYQNMTGVYFDFVDNNEELSGFVSYKGDRNSLPGLLPFEFDLKEHEPTYLWDRIGMVLNKKDYTVLDSTAKQFKQKLEIK